MSKRIKSKEEKRHNRVMKEIQNNFRENWTREGCRWEFDKQLIVMEHAFDFHKGRTTNRSEFINSVNQIDPDNQKVLIKMLDNEDPTEEVWKSLGL